MKKAFILFSTFALSLFATHAQMPKDTIQLIIDLPLLDLPYAPYAANVEENQIANITAKPQGGNPVKMWASPSMEQSTQFSLNTRYLMFYASKKLFNRKPSDKFGKKIWKNGLEATLNLAVDQILPFGQVWQHEEFHRATMTHLNCFSNNTMNDWITGRQNANSPGVKSVNAVLDTNLVMIKAQSNPDFVRIMTAGGEGEIYSGEQMQKNGFFYETGYLNLLPLVFRFFSPMQYISLCANREKSTAETLIAMEKEGSVQKLRDFTGLDFSAWAYDLYNPKVAYAERGLNPYGNGYDRYIYGNKLSIAQYDWLKKQGNLALLNFISPQNVGFNTFTLKKYADGSTLKGNFAFRYYPTSFGNQIGLNLFLKKGKYNLFVNAALNQNLKHSFPSLEAQLVDYQFHSRIMATTSLMLWKQPQNQDFFTNKASVGTSVAATVHYKAAKNVYPYLNFSYKTKGWVAGNVFLNQTWGCRLGLSFRF